MSDAMFDSRRSSFGARAGDYDRVRPWYPRLAVAQVVTEAGWRVVDVGTGTGRLLVTCAELGAEAIGVEPDAAMAGAAASHPGARVVRGRAERLPLASGSCDAVVVGQAWHWFDHAAAATECARVLRPGGRIGIFRNLRDEHEPWVAALGRIIGGEDRRVDDFFGAHTIDLGPGFEVVVETEVTHDHRLAPADVVTLAATHSYVAVHPERDRMLDEVRRLVVTHPDLRDRDEVAMPYICAFFTATRR